MNKKHTYYLSLGGNEGDKVGFLQQAKKVLLERGNTLISESAFYQTEPFEMEEGTEPFINQALIIESKLDPIDFLNLTKKIEKSIGRINKGEKKSRNIDIDILFCDDLVIQSKNLNIPHPEMVKRNFVIIPLEEICPNLNHPILNKSITEIAQSLKDNHWIKKLD